MSKHTPGSWSVIDNVDVANHGRRVVGSGRVVAACECLDTEQNEANANLIAAAPKLLEALKRIVDAGTWYYCALELDHDQNGEELEEMARSAIAKAEPTDG